MFKSVEGSVRFPQMEDEIGRFWKSRQIYEKSLERRAGSDRFVFYEGPPTANGLPHPGHCLTRAIKDLFPRYRTMRGYLCERKAGWDTHGLPVEVEVCKELGIHSKEEIEAYGIEPFIHKCLESVFRYTQQWERMTERLGFWVNLDEAYVTYHQTYIESVWWALKTLYDRKLLYQGHKIVWWWAQGGTALSSGEVGQGYREVADPSIYVRFPLVYDEAAVALELPTDTSLLVWTTTPWTLFSNMLVAVHPEIDYALVYDGSQHLIIAKDLVQSLGQRFSAKTWDVKATISGKALVNKWHQPTADGGYDEFALRYKPPFHEVFYDKRVSDFTGGDEKGILGQFKAPSQSPKLKSTFCWNIKPASFVTTDSGTGLVHIAPAFGEDDYRLWLYEIWDSFSPPFNEIMFCPVAPNGTFTSEVPEQFVGRWVKEADKDITRDLRRCGLLYHQEQYLHEYPFCWRAEEDPLIQYPRKSWFIRTTAFKDAMLANNQQINWLPEHIKDGRFGNFLESNVDWALSRERYWGTPLPIWVSEKDPNYQEAIGSYAELLAKPGVAGLEVWEAAKRANPNLSEHLKVHKPYIDAVTYTGPSGERMRRVPDVIDCWFDSGAMPFAQWGYPHQNHDKFGEQFPADFISEAIDQTRGWFYSLLAISTMLFAKSEVGIGNSELSKDVPTSLPQPFRNCIVLGLMLGEDGGKMSKSKRNYREPNEIFDRYGADALRWYFFANQPPWTSIRYNEQSIKDSIPEFLLRLWNVYSFFTIYANIDEFDPAARVTGSVEQLTSAELAQGKNYRPVSQRSELDRWILGELQRTIASVIERMDAYDNYAACQQITEFVDALSNWYVRRSRDRFWAADKQDRDKLDAHWTLYECLITTSKLVAPFVPFVAEAIWQNLAVATFGERVSESVHLCDFPEPQLGAINRELSERMHLVREIVSLGRAARMGAKLKVRQPLAKVEVILADRKHLAWLEEHRALVAEELNVKEVEYPPRADQYITYTVQPDLKRLGPRLGKRLPALKAAIASADAAALLSRLEQDKQVTIDLPDGPVILDTEDLQVRLQAKEGWAAAQGPGCVVVLSTAISSELVAEGLARELVHAIANVRRDMNCNYTDRIGIGLQTEDKELTSAVRQFAEYIQGETLATCLELDSLDGAKPQSLKIGSSEVQLYVKVQPQ